MKALLWLMLSVMLLGTDASAQSDGSWQTTNLGGIHYAVNRNALQPNRWQAELQHTYDCESPCIIDFDDRMSAVFLRYKWMTVNPEPGVYDFGAMGDVIDKIHESGKNVTLVVMAGKYTPTWVFDQGAQHIDTRAIESGEDSQSLIPVPWDPIYLAAHKDMIDALAKYLHETPSRYSTVVLIKNAALSIHSEETRLMPADAFQNSPAEGDDAGKDVFRTGLCADWARAGYTERKVLDANNAVNAQIDAAFPDKYIGIAFVAGSAEFPTVDADGKCTFPAKNQTLDNIIKETVNAYGPRAAINSTVLSEKKGNPPILKWVLDNGGKIGFQINAQIAGCREKSKSATKAKCNTDSIMTTFQAGIDAGATFIEVHDGNVEENKDMLAEVNATLEGR